MYECIYLVDDEELVNFMNAIKFRKLGLEDKVKTFTNPEEALENLRHNKTQNKLILLDINMPEMNGFEFLEFMTQEAFPSSNEVLIVTSSETQEDKRKSQHYSAYVKDFISKPLKLEALKAFLEKANQKIGI